MKPVEAEGLVRTFGEVTAVAGIDLEVAEGEIFGFLGPNGAGKSTTVRMLVTLLQGAMFSGVGTAGTVATDLETGFMDRLLVSPACWLSPAESPFSAPGRKPI